MITEIETSGFSGLKPKLEAYLDEYKVRLVYPLAYAKYVSWIDPESGEITSRKKSPKKANVYEALFEMVRILPYVNHKNLTILMPILEIDEYRLLDGWNKDKKRGSHRYERIPTDLFRIEEFSADADYIRCIPENCGESFTLKEFSKEAHVNGRDANGIVKVLMERGLLERVGKRGQSYLYARTNKTKNAD
ncbi:MAG: hypothetical protein IJ334_11235 [Clostridia bacterium]|nr:hypothetical protein [Clostridia bacterium]